MGRTGRREHLADVETDDLGEAEAGAEREGVDRMVAGVSGRCEEDRLLFAAGPEPRQVKAKGPYPLPGRLIGRGMSNTGGI